MWPFQTPKESAELFYNESRLYLSDANYNERLPELDLGSFPTVEDFAIRLEQTSRFGMHLLFYSPTLGFLASFPWWDHVEKALPHYTLSSIPTGESREPFDDLEQSWQILIFEHKDSVYVMQGDDPCCIEFHTWFAVGRDRYFDEWKKVIRQFKSPTP